MSALASAVEDYLVVRRALGYRLARSEKLLAQLVAYCEQRDLTTVTTEAAVAWASLPDGASTWWWSQRLGVVRVFASWLAVTDPATEVPPADVFGPVRSCRAVPFLYTDAEIGALMDAAEGLRYPLERATYRSLIGLLAVSGMRIGEVIRLDVGHVDWPAAELVVEHSKFNKSRRVALHPSTVDALRAYASLRDKQCPQPKAPSFFISSAGTRLDYPCVSTIFHKLVGRAGLQARSERCRPRLHDFRH